MTVGLLLLGVGGAAFLIGWWPDREWYKRMRTGQKQANPRRWDGLTITAWGGWLRLGGVLAVVAGLVVCAASAIA